MRQSHQQTPTEDVDYVGHRRHGRPVVQRYPDGTELSPECSLEMMNHSPTAFEWGYNGSGPAQLALAILLDYTGDHDVALEHYMRFKDEVVSELTCAGSDGHWRLTASEIEDILHTEVDSEVTARV